MTTSFLRHTLSRVELFKMIFLYTNLFVNILSKAYKMTYLMYPTDGIVVDLKFSFTTIIVFPASIFDGDETNAYF